MREQPGYNRGSLADNLLSVYVVLDEYYPLVDHSLFIRQSLARIVTASARRNALKTILLLMYAANFVQLIAVPNLVNRLLESVSNHNLDIVIVAAHCSPSVRADH